MLLFALTALLAAPAEVPTPQALQALGSATLGRFEEQGGTWTYRNPTGGKADFGVRTTTFHRARRFELLVWPQGKEAVVLGTIVEKDGRWTTRAEGAPLQVTWPYEAVLRVPVFYVALMQSQPLALEPSRLASPKPISVSDQTVTFSAAPSDASKAALETLERAVKEAERAGVPAPKLDEQRAKLEKLRTLKPTVEVDRATGLILSSGQEGPRWSSVAVLDAAPKDAFDMADAEPAPRFTAPELKDALMLSWYPAWKPGVPQSDMDAVLVEPEGGGLRRIPNTSGISQSGTFLSARNLIVVPSTTRLGGFAPRLIDLSTGAQRFLAHLDDKPGYALFPTASPDGKKVSVLSSGGSSVLESLLQVIDVATDAVVNVGAPADQAFVSWLPSGSGFILLRRHEVKGEPDKHHAVVRIDLQGRETLVVDNATHPVLLSDRKTVLYKDRPSDEWRTCSLDGKNVKRFGDGMKDFFEPSPSPDGTRLAMMKKGDAPRLYIIDLKTMAATESPLPPGLWAYPRWQ